MSHFIWVISYDVIAYDSALIEQQKLNEFFFFKLKKNKKSNKIQKMVIQTGSKIGPLNKSGPVRFCHARFGPEMPSEQSKRKKWISARMCFLWRRLLIGLEPTRFYFSSTNQ